VSGKGAASPRLRDRQHLFGGGPCRNGDEQRGFSGWSKANAALDERILEAHQSLEMAKQADRQNW